MYVPLVVVNYLNCDKLGRKKIDVGENPREHEIVHYVHLPLLKKKQQQQQL